MRRQVCEIGILQFFKVSAFIAIDPADPALLLERQQDKTAETVTVCGCRCQPQDSRRPADASQRRRTGGVDESAAWRPRICCCADPAGDLFRIEIRKGTTFLN